MVDALQTSGHELRERAAVLLSQQVWCWGRDILHDRGNWLIEYGFERLTKPDQGRGCPSIYRLALPEERSVLLRGFGVLYTDARLGGVFLPRYNFVPRFRPDPTAKELPWTPDDLPDLCEPSRHQRAACGRLIAQCIEWIAQYEVQTIEQLGIRHRVETLKEWDDGTREVIPGKVMAKAWQDLSQHAASDTDVFLQPERHRGRLNRFTRKQSLRRASRAKARHSATRYLVLSRWRSRSAPASPSS